MAAPTIESSTVAESAGSVTSLAVDKPTGTSDGDLLLFYLSADETPTVTPPGGLTEIYLDTKTAGSATTAGAWRKTAGASEPASYSFSLGVAEQIILVCLRISGFDDTTPIDVHAEEQEEAFDSTPEFSGMTTSVDETLNIYAYHDGISGTDGDDTGYPAGTTGLYARENGAVLGVAHEAQASAGATGSKTWTLPNTGRRPWLSGLAVKPGAGSTTHQETASLTAALQKQRDLSLASDAALAAEESTAASLDGVLQSLATHGVGIDGALRGALQAQAELDAALRAGAAGDAGLDAALARAGTIATALDLAAERARLLSGALDAVLGAPGAALLSADLAAALQATQSLALSLTAAVRKAGLLASGLDAALSRGGAVGAIVSGSLARTGTVLLLLQAVILRARLVAVGVGAALEARCNVTSLFDAVIGPVSEPLTPRDARSLAVAQARDHDLAADERALRPAADQSCVVTAEGRTIIVPRSSRRH